MKKVPLYLIMGLVGLLVVVGVGGGTAYLVLAKLAPKQGPMAAEVNLEAVSVIELKPFLTNLADTGQSRYISVSLTLVAPETKTAKKVEQNLPLLRDGILSAVSQLKATEVLGEAGATKLKTLVLDRVNNLLGGKFIQKVLVTDLVVQ